LLGDQQDNLTGLAVDNSGNAYVTGDTASGTFPTTPGAYARTWAGPGSVFVTRVNAAGSALVYSTFVGVAGTTGLGYSIAVDGAGSAYVSGTTLSASFPTVNAPQPQYGAPEQMGLIPDDASEDLWDAQNRGELGTAHGGTKVGAWPVWSQEPAALTCPRAHEMRYLLSFDAQQWYVTS
jgi:hypothetical protein